MPAGKACLADFEAQLLQLCDAKILHVHGILHGIKQWRRGTRWLPRVNVVRRKLVPVLQHSRTRIESYNNLVGRYA